MKKETFLIPAISLVFAIFSQHLVTSKTTTRIKFENGLYNGIVIGIDEDNTTDCARLLNNLKNVLPIFSSKLYEATGTARIGTVQILLPLDWTNAQCGLSSSEIIEALPHFSYASSDLKISRDHPFAQSLPWTNQYKPCGQGGDYIIIPPQFLLDTVSTGGLSDSIKAQILLHEWTKFRYGAFDEIGFEGDALFPPCYSRTQSGAQLSCCTQADLSSVTVDPSDCTLSLLMGKKESLIQELSQSPSSVMSSPYIDNVAHFCNKTTHNGWSNTKHNVYCKRKSVSEVVNEHSDFKTTRSTPHQWQQDPLKIQFVKQTRTYESAYTFVIDDSLEMRNGFKGVHVKQSIAQFLEILELGTEIRVVVFTETQIVVSKGKKLNTEQDKEDILCYAQSLDIPCNNNLIDNMTKVTNRASRQLAPVIDEVISTLSSHASFSWNVLLFTGSQEVQDVSNSVQKFGQSNHSISILTFDASSEWLEWYGIPNTKNVLGIPYCSSPTNTNPCSLLSTSFITDYLISILNEQQFQTRFLVKAAQVELPITSGFRVRFEMNLDADQIKRVYFLVSLPVNASNIGNTLRLEHVESRAICRAKILLGYAYVVKFIDDDGNGLAENCSYRNGAWEAVLETNMPAAQMRLQVFLEPIDTFDRLIVTPSLGLSDLTKGIHPTTNLTSVFVNVKTDKDTPILGAQVSLQVYHLSSFPVSEVVASKAIVLADSGNGADQTGNDGMYSAFLSGYSQTPAFHLLQVQVQTNNETKMLTSIQSPNAILLDEKMIKKCCGKTVNPSTTSPLPFMTLHTLHLGLKTIESFDEIQYPPGRINTITIDADNDTTITLQFESVSGQIGEDNIVLRSVEACCVPSNGGSPPSELNCANDTTNCGSFRPPGELQACYIDKGKLVNTFLSNETNVNLLVCALRTIGANAEGELSSGMFSVDVKAAVDAVTTTPECNNLSDGCLPKTIFWVMIGCLGLLLLIIILLLVGWCCYCSSQKKKAKVNEPPAKPMTSLPPPRTERSVYFDRHLDDQPSSQQNAEKEPKIVKELFVNHAYIQDGDGEIKIIADSGEILRKPKNENDDVMQNRNQIKTIPITTRPTSTTPIRSPTDNMQIFKPAPPPKPKTTMTRTSPHRSKGRRVTSRPEIVHPNPMLRSDSIHDMQQPQEYALQPATPALPPQPSYSTFQPPTERVDPSIVYATVSRAGRLKPVSPVEKTATLPSRRVNIDPHYMVPHHSVKHIGPRQRDPLPNLYPPQVEAYPSSDTESDAHHQNQQHYPTRPNRYSKPPPYPAGSQLFNQNQSTFGAEGGRGQNQTVVNPAVSVPPVPPPRYGVAGGRSSVPPQEHHQMSSDPDEDSDEWDDEDFDFNPGMSYA